MAKFRARVLEALDNIYDVIGGLAGISRLDLSAPVQIVHDVSREAGYGSGRSPEDGWQAVTVTNTHPGADTQQTQLDPYDELGLNTARDRVWVMGARCLASSNPANISYARVACRYPTTVGLFPTLVILSMMRGDSFDAASQLLPEIGGVPVVEPNQFPFYIPPVGRVECLSISSAAGAVQADWLLWVGARGALPPGL